MKPKHIVIVLSALAVMMWIAIAVTTYKDNQDRAKNTRNTDDKTASLETAPSAKEIIRLTNEYRATKGLSSLVENEKLNQSACLKAQDMIENDYFEHVSPNGIDPWYWFNQVEYTYRNAGENLAYQYRFSDDIVNGWIDSPTHEANLSGDYTEIGACVKFLQTKEIAVAHYATPR